MNTDQHSLAALAKQTIIYGLSGAALQFIGLITLPVFSRQFTPAEYGVIEIGSVVYSLLATLTDGGMASASQRNYFAYTDEQRRPRGTVMLTALADVLTIGTVLAVDPRCGQWAGSRGGCSRAAVTARCWSWWPPRCRSAQWLQFTREAMRLKFRAWHYVTSAILAALVGAAVSLVEVLLLAQRCRRPVRRHACRKRGRGALRLLGCPTELRSRVCRAGSWAACLPTGSR